MFKVKVKEPQPSPVETPAAGPTKAGITLEIEQLASQINGLVGRKAVCLERLAELEAPDVGTVNTALVNPGALLHLALGRQNLATEIDVINRAIQNVRAQMPALQRQLDKFNGAELRQEAQLLREQAKTHRAKTKDLLDALQAHTGRTYYPELRQWDYGDKLDAEGKRLETEAKTLESGPNNGVTLA